MQKSYVVNRRVNLSLADFYINPGDILRFDPANNNALAVYRDQKLVKTTTHSPISMQSLVNGGFIELIASTTDETPIADPDPLKPSIVEKVEIVAETAGLKAEAAVEEAAEAAKAEAEKLAAAAKVEIEKAEEEAEKIAEEAKAEAEKLAAEAEAKLKDAETAVENTAKVVGKKSKGKADPAKAEDAPEAPAEEEK